MTILAKSLFLLRLGQILYPVELRSIRGNRKSIMILVIGLLAGSKEKKVPKSLPSNTEMIVSLGMLRPP